jgi:hypothetical protein
MGVQSVIAGVLTHPSSAARFPTQIYLMAPFGARCVVHGGVCETVVIATKRLLLCYSGYQIGERLAWPCR